MKHDRFSECHPIVNLLFFIFAIGFTVIVQHPAYILISCIMSFSYLIMLRKQAGFGMLISLFPIFLMITVLNPLINTDGRHILFYLMHRPYTLEAMCYGAALAGIFLSMMGWFGCYSHVFTGEKFTALFGNLMPSLSLLLVMVLRLIPSFTRKIKHISGVRGSIGKGIAQENTTNQKIKNGVDIISAMTDWALENSIITADSMRARGYGTGKRTSFQIYTMMPSDWILLFLILILAILSIFMSDTEAIYTPRLYFAYVGWGYIAFCLLMSLPILLKLCEEIQWNRLRSRI